MISEEGLRLGFSSAYGSNPFRGMYGDIEGIGKLVSYIQKHDIMPRSEICDNLRDLYKANNDHFIGSQLSWIEKLYQ